MNGKGSKPRPLSVSYEEYGNQFDQIFRKRFTPENISQLQPDEVFVFGSNEGGIHGAGAAAIAHKKFGATWGVAAGPTGQCYAIPTKDKNIKTLPLERIEVYINAFLVYAKKHQEKKFLLTKVGCGLAGYSENEIAALLKGKVIPENVVVPESFWKIIKSN